MVVGLLHGHRAAGEESPGGPENTGSEGKPAGVGLRRKRALIVLAVACLLAVPVFWGIVQFSCSGDLVMKGVFCGGVDFSGLGPEEVRSGLAAVENRLYSSGVVVETPDGAVRLGLSDLGIKLDLAATAEKIMTAGRQGSLGKRLREWCTARREGLRIGLVVIAERERALAVIKGVALPYEQAARNAVLEIDDQDRVKVVGEREGRKADIEGVVESIIGQLSRGESPRARLTFSPVRPAITAEQVKAMKITGLVSEYSTRFNPANKNRSENIRVAAEALNNLLITPGEVFSFNAVVGPRSEDRGYKEAVVIEGGEMVAGVGGGVCQVSSTLYNAVLRAGLPIRERKHHSRMVGYVPAGLDATVAYGVIDLKFHNPSSGYLLLKTEVRPGYITVKIFGPVAELPQTSVHARVERVIPPPVITRRDSTLGPGASIVEEEGAQGVVVRVTRTVPQPDGSVKEELVSRDYYPAVPRVVRVGVGDSGMVKEEKREHQEDSEDSSA